MASFSSAGARGGGGGGGRNGGVGGVQEQGEAWLTACGVSQ